MAKFIAAALSLVVFNFVILVVGFPQFGTFGFLLLVNILHGLLLLTYRSQPTHPRCRWAKTISLIAILLAVVSLFRDSSIALAILGYSTLVLTVMTYYLFGLSHGNISSVLELFTLPLAVLWSGITSVIDFARKHQPRWQMLSVVSIPAAGVVLLFLGYWIITGLQFKLIFQLIGLNLLFFSMVLMLLHIEIKNPFKDMVDTAYLKNSVIELSLLSLVCTTILGAYLVINHYEMFLLTNSQSLINHGFSSIAAFVWDGVAKLAVVGIASYLLISLVHAGSNQFHERSHWLKASAVGFVIVFSLFSLSVLRRLFWYISEFGFTANRLYVLIAIMLVLVYCISLIVRFVRGWFKFWWIGEFGLILTFVFGVGIINIEALVAQSVADQEYDLISCEQLSQSSADAAFSWVVCFEVASQLVDKTNIDQLDSISAKEGEDLKLASMIIDRIHDHYIELDAKYGELILTPDFDPSTAGLSGFKRFITSILGINLAQWHGYTLLKNEISFVDLIQKQLTAASMVEYLKVKE